MKSFSLKVLAFLVTSLLNFCVGNSFQELLLITTATEETGGLQRYIRSTKTYNVNTKVLSLSASKCGGDAIGTCGGHKITVLKEELALHKHSDDLIIMVTDSDAVITTGASEILAKFKTFNARVVFSVAGFPLTHSSILKETATETENGKRPLSSKGFIGYAKDMYEIVSFTTPSADDQEYNEYFTNLYNNECLRESWTMKLDTMSQIFINLDKNSGNPLDDVVMKFRGLQILYNSLTSDTVHAVILGSASIKVDDYPNVLIGVFVEYTIPFLREFLQKIAALDYPKRKLDLFIHNVKEYHSQDVDKFLTKYKSSYRSVVVYRPESQISEETARNSALDECMEKGCQYFFSVNGDVHLDNNQTLKLLIQQNRSVLAPMVLDDEHSNFWESKTKPIPTIRPDYKDIFERKKIGTWAVPCGRKAYLIQSHVLALTRHGYHLSNSHDAELALCDMIARKGFFMFLTNTIDFGHVINTKGAQTTTNRMHIELWEIFNNQIDWEKRYIHPNYHKSFEEDAVLEQPCPDVFWFPMVTEEFCDDLVEEMENFGQWSGGKNKDPRIQGGYENVPTDDIHMSQIGLHEHFLYFLEDYVAPLALKVYDGYDNGEPEADMNFVVKYNPERQRELRPHYDESMYTINIALNRPNLDYEGGGCRFLRYNCSVVDTRKGWMLMHPGKLTHQHMGLPTTKGTRYILVSFVDP